MPRPFMAPLTTVILFVACDLWGTGPQSQVMTVEPEEIIIAVGQTDTVAVTWSGPGFVGRSWSCSECPATISRLASRGDDLSEFAVHGERPGTMFVTFRATTTACRDPPLCLIEDETQHARRVLTVRVR